MAKAAIVADRDNAKNISIAQQQQLKKNEQIIAGLRHELAALKVENSALHEQNLRLDRLFQASQEARAALDPTFNFIAFNQSFIKAAATIFDVSLCLGMNFSSLLMQAPSCKTRILSSCYQALAGVNSSILIENATGAGDYYCYELHISSNLNPLTKLKELHLSIHDCSRYKLQEFQARKQQAEIERVGRSNVMGELISALAHEINQPLTAIKAFSRGCLLKLKRDSSISALAYPLTQIAHQSEHAGNILHRMKNFMRDGSMYLEKTDINALIRQTLSFLDYEFSQFKVAINLELADNLPELSVDRIKIMQVILNLGRNSIEAFQTSATLRPTIKIKTECLEKDMVIHFQDNGPGIPANLRDKILSSYFTTKPQGTGLGLSICKTLVNAHGGSLQSLTSLEGAWFTVSLPLEVN